MKPIIDMYLAASIVAYGGKIEKVDRSDPDKQRFYFKDRPINFIIVLEDGELETRKEVQVEDICDAFISKILVFPPNFPESIRTIKTAIYTGK